MAKKRELIRVTYMGALTAFDLGSDIEIDVIKRYRYAGELREKLRSLSRPYRVVHNRTGVGEPAVSIACVGQSMEVFKADAEAAVYRVIL